MDVLLEGLEDSDGMIDIDVDMDILMETMQQEEGDLPRTADIAPDMASVVPLGQTVQTTIVPFQMTPYDVPQQQFQACGEQLDLAAEAHYPSCVSLEPAWLDNWDTKLAPPAPVKSCEVCE